MSRDSTLGYDIYYGITNAKGETRIAYARVWDGERFLDAQRKAGASAANKEDRFTISSASHADYMRQTGRRF